MEWETGHLGRLGLAGICLEILRLLRRAIFLSFNHAGGTNLATFLLVNATVSRALSSGVARGLREGTNLFRLIAYLAVLSLVNSGCVLLFLQCTAAYVLCVTSLYRTGGDLRVLHEDLPVVPLTRQLCRFFLVAVVFASLSLPSMHRIGGKTRLPLCLLVWASAAYVAVVCQMAGVVLVLEDATLFGALRRSRELLAGNFWAAACVFVTLDGGVIALLKAFPALVVDDAPGREPWFKGAAWVAIDLALRAVLVVTLVAQPVVYMVCKSHLDMAHLD